MQSAEWKSRFERLAACKTSDALTATIDPFATDEDRAGGGVVPVGNGWSRRMFDGPFYMSPPPSSDLPATNLVFAQSRDGNTVARNPSTLGGGEADKHLIYEGLSRVAADAVLGGHATLRDGDLVLSGTPFYSKPLKGRPIVRKRGTGADAGVGFEHLLLSRGAPPPLADALAP